MRGSRIEGRPSEATQGGRSFVRVEEFCTNLGLDGSTVRALVVGVFDDSLLAVDADDEVDRDGSQDLGWSIRL